ncbi:hypothetical protein BC833DRAFT_569749, partial [Globomyces pollinis-pini]
VIDDTTNYISFLAIYSDSIHNFLSHELNLNELPTEKLLFILLLGGSNSQFEPVPEWATGDREQNFAIGPTYSAMNIILEFIAKTYWRYARRLWEYRADISL